LVSTAADVIGTELGHAFTIAGREVYLSASIGIALSPRDGDTAAKLLQRADLAMSQAKKAGGNHHRFYSPGIESRMSHPLDLEARLPRALKVGELAVTHQTQASLADGTINSVEALLRWNSPELGWVSPAEFIPVA